MFARMTTTSTPHIDIIIGPLQCCLGCRYWKWRGEGSKFGECRRMPPDVSRDNPPAAEWPVTQELDCCGEWQPERA